ncbi:hypothetical protein E2562_004685 [Oryza meyeriana var. granulata]|uniref:Uncharacterized protein n=1 Tax=Oryza meyeriana var. granulata TaxID=110450 RepID=A0A6G1DG24_9ORYZ|nr:hypothetical protein E2562_004685 [Oryza meyeriana var. granulata]
MMAQQWDGDGGGDPRGSRRSSSAATARRETRAEHNHLLPAWPGLLPPNSDTLLVKWAAASTADLRGRALVFLRPSPYGRCARGVSVLP